MVLKDHIQPVKEHIQALNKGMTISKSILAFNLQTNCWYIAKCLNDFDNKKLNSF